MRAHHFHFVHKAEGAGAGDFVDIGLAGEIDFKSGGAAVEDGMVKLDGEADFESVVGREGHALAFGFNGNGFDDFQKTLLRFLIDDARILQQINEG